ncbi:MAG TPA: DUF5615 family PIN-like protein [bacterium]|nr:DUF5615 family PIN-like protein [bacterium]
MTVKMLRDAGHDVLSVAEDMAGAEDRAILSLAAKEKRTILTFDADYGELIYQKRMAVPAGLVFLRFMPKNPGEPAKILLMLLEKARTELEGHFTVLERDRIRQRPLAQ